MISHTLFIEPNIMESHKYVSRIIEFCSSICTKITFGALVGNYNLSESDYKNACNDFLDYYRCEDKKRRDEFISNLAYKNTLLYMYQTDEEVSRYFDRLYQYDLIQFNELKNDLKKHLNTPTKNMFSRAYDYKERILTKKAKHLPCENYLRSKYTFESHCTIGGIYKVYEFKLTCSIIKNLLNYGDLFKYYIFDNIDTLEDPAFYSNNILILSVCSHERTTTLFLSNEQFNIFKKIDVPYNLV